AAPPPRRRGGRPRRHVQRERQAAGRAAVSGTMASSPGSVSVEPRVAQPTSETSAPSTSSSARLSPACSTVSRLAARPAAAAAALAAAGGPFIGGPRLPDRRNMSRSFYIACRPPEPEPLESWKMCMLVVPVLRGGGASLPWAAGRAARASRARAKMATRAPCRRHQGRSRRLGRGTGG
ncbi:unnamed protein product, partial [Prorocentrum cordatum]